MEIRLLNSLDAENYLDLRLEALQNSPEAFAASYEEEKDQSFEKYKSRFQSQDSFTFGAFENEKLIGVVTLVKEKKLKLKHRANIFAMYVSPEKRGIGAGKSLMLEAIKKAKELEGIEQIYLTVVTTNDPAKRLYSSLGFKAFGKDKRAIMSKCLALRHYRRILI
ncbi:GNAT family N-acetyltransferase [Terrilactibacillus sp. BCM23-1]|uniref:GNAT family N-acetyltransferase n=1 Tax=Terrilactibacillus tamarindi TaxID=2599694 RepID=A0A6N8CMV9_9BACI|nr:GNAT family N-acetyltransferase [Terrilactibacillus tamarindi]MTT31434.1 GNAT family N-acetyltransferase [Terrilactibacillus tamarindi]